MSSPLKWPTGLPAAAPIARQPTAGVAYVCSVLCIFVLPHRMLQITLGGPSGTGVNKDICKSGSAATTEVGHHFTRPPFDSITPETRSSKLLQRPSTSRVALMSSTTPFKRFSYWARASNQHWLGVVVVTEHSLSNSIPLQLESELQEASHRTLTFEFDSNATRI